MEEISRLHLLGYRPRVELGATCVEAVCYRPKVDATNMFRVCRCRHRQGSDHYVPRRLSEALGDGFQLELDPVAWDRKG